MADGRTILEQYRRGVARLLQLLDVPFGYTLTIWGAGSIATARYGSRDMTSVACFIAGAIAGYFSFAALEFRLTAEAMPVRRPQGVMLFNVAPLAVLGPVALLVHAIAARWLGFLLSGYLATAAYIAILGLAWSLRLQYWPSAAADAGERRS